MKVHLGLGEEDVLVVVEVVEVFVVDVVIKSVEVVVVAEQLQEIRIIISK